MKKIISLMLVLVLAMGVLVGCNSEEEPETPDTPAVEDTDESEDTDETDETEAVAGEITKLGLGQNISIGKSADAEGDKGAVGQADITMAAVGFDNDGKVVSVTLDVSQAKVEYDENLAITSDVDAEVKTKKVLKDDYGMKKASEIEKEWYEQAEAFEEWMVGKTIDEITGLKVKEVNESHQNVPDVPELTSSVTITVEGYLAAVEEAWENAIDVSGGEKVGLGVKTGIASSKSLDGDQMPVAQADTYMTATAFDADGKVVGTIIDTAQVKIEFDADGKVTTDKDAELKTKHELKEDYGMVKASEIGKEWYEQMTAFQEWMVGKTVDEITGLPVKEVNESHQNVPDVPELTSTVTITVEGYLDVIQRASDNAK